MRAYRRWAIVLVAAVTLGAVLQAHMKFEKSAPAADSTITAPPPSIQVWFSQAPDEKVSKLGMTGPKGPIELTGLHAMSDKSIMATVGGNMPDGEYTVAWQAAGDDGHIQKGEFSFTLKRAD